MVTDELIEIAALALWKHVAVNTNGTRDLDAEWHRFTESDREVRRDEARAVINAIAKMIRYNALEEAADTAQEAIRELIASSEFYCN